MHQTVIYVHQIALLEDSVEIELVILCRRLSAAVDDRVPEHPEKFAVALFIRRKHRCNLNRIGGNIFPLQEIIAHVGAAEALVVIREQRPVHIERFPDNIIKVRILYNELEPGLETLPLSFPAVLAAAGFDGHLFSYPVAELEQQIPVQTYLAVEVSVECAGGNACQLCDIRNIRAVIPPLVYELGSGRKNVVECLNALLGSWNLQQIVHILLHSKRRAIKS